MNVVNRGNTNLLKAIQQGAKQVSMKNGIAEQSLVDDSLVKSRVEEAFGSIPNSTETHSMSNQSIFTNTMTRIDPRVSVNNPKISSNDFKDTLVFKLQKSIETLAETGEYYNAVDSLFTLYTMGALTDGVVDSITRRDLKEIKAIVNEFKDTVDSF